jgi:hypothetical protein
VAGRTSPLRQRPLAGRAARRSVEELDCSRPEGGLQRLVLADPCRVEPAEKAEPPLADRAAGVDRALEAVEDVVATGEPPVAETAAEEAEAEETSERQASEEPSETAG